MSSTLRILLIAGSALAFICILRKIRKCQLEIGDAIYWFIFAGVLIVIAVFPQLIIVPSTWIGIDSPANFLFLIIIFVVVAKQFSMALQVALLRSKLRSLAQVEALQTACESVEEAADGE